LESTEAADIPVLSFKKRKPVIYLFSPVDRDASIKLSLSSDWSFSTIYPEVPIKHPRDTVNAGNCGEYLEWNVRTNAESKVLFEKNSGLTVSYLFWEADSRPVRPESPPLSPGAAVDRTNERFVPASANLCDDDSVLLSSKQTTMYLERSLEVLGLHVEARTSFITFWLPYFQKYTHVALRFIPQRSLELAAPLSVTPQPDVITRVFMLFKGVTEEEAAKSWQSATLRATESVESWREIVGISQDKYLDESLFRVLEWGGMEVPSVAGAI
jgi:hypothetical protein